MTAAQTLVKYNGVTIRQVQTLLFDQEPVYDDSDTDQLYHKFTCRFSGYVHGRSNWGGPDDGSGGNEDAEVGAFSTNKALSGNSATDMWTNLRTRLSENRADFEMIVGADENDAGGKTLLKAIPFPDGQADPTETPDADLNNGPKPRDVRIERIVQDELFHVEFEIEICIADCNGDNKNNKGLLNNRWSVSEDIDQNLRTTRTYTGTLVVATSNFSTQLFRAVVLPPMVPLMRRDSMQFTTTKDGLRLDWQVVDKETPYSPPPPATRWILDASEETKDLGTPYFNYATATCELEAPSTVNRSTLLAAASAAVRAKLTTLNDKQLDRTNYLVLSYQAAEHTDNDSTHIRVSCKVVRTGLEGPANWLALAQHHIGRDLADYRAFRQVVKNYRSYLNSGNRFGEEPFIEGPVKLAGMAAAYLQRPCSDEHQTDKEGAGSPDGRVGSFRGTIRRERSGGKLAPIVNPRDTSGSLEHRRLPYMHWRMQTTYNVTPLVAAMPRAGGPASVDVSTSIDLDDPKAITVPAPTTHFVTLGRPQAKRIVRVEAQRVGSYPDIPAPQSFYQDGTMVAVLLSSSTRLGTIEKSADGNHIYSAHAEFIFALSRPPFPGERLRVGYTPWLRDPDGIERTPSGFQTQSEADIA